MKIRSIIAAFLFATTLLFGGNLWALPVPIDLSTWSVIQYDHVSGQPDANWVLSGGNTVARQTVNADASILLGDFDIANKQIEGTWRVDTTSDNDFMGFVFGYQGRDEFYLFDWKQEDQDYPQYGFAQAGMSVKIVDVGGGGDPSGPDLWQSAGTSNVTVLRQNSIGWADLVDYDFRLNFLPGLFEIEVSQGATTLQNWVISDSTFTSGEFGFYNFSQGEVVYTGFTQSTIPEPAAMLLIGTGLVGLAAFSRRKFRQ